MDKILDPVLRSVRLPELLAELNERYAAEQRRRLHFYQELTPYVKAEFIQGQAVYHSPATRRHSTSQGNLLVLLKMFVESRGLGEVLGEKALVSLTRNDYEPDIAFWARKKAAVFTDEMMHFPAPDFVVEVLSKSTARYERGIKMQDYAQHGVQEYWIVDPLIQVVEQHLLEAHQFSASKFFLSSRKERGDIITSVIIPGFNIPVMAVFESKAFVNAAKELLA